ncbi:MAG TPA: hypothetical protein VFR37_25460, partial [Longimicrobium sp.]|nr:hypothetical protein [Longimicrobium sp.]
GRDRLCAALAGAGLSPTRASGGYFVLADVRALGRRDAGEAVLALIDKAGVGAVPGGRFFSTPGAGDDLARFCFAKSDETLGRAELGLRRLAERGRARAVR